MTNSRPERGAGALRGQPTGLYILFFTEMWERFSYYGMRALLIFYMTKHLLFAQEKASHIYGLYTGLIWFTPLFGGLLADRVWGQRKTVIIGGSIMALGHFLMALEPMFFPALALIVLGFGCLKPNVSTQVGGLYAEGDHRRDRAFSIFYVGINLGAFIAPLVCGTLGELYGWHYGFAAAGVGMVAGLAVYILGQKHLAPDLMMKKAAARKPSDKPLTADEKKRLLALAVLGLFNIAFWAGYEQQGNTLALFADKFTDRRILGWEMPATWFQSFNPAMIFLFTPLVTWFWSWQERRGTEPSSVAKLAIGCLLLGASFLVLIPPARSLGPGGASLGWLTACAALMTLGELYLSPIGLSLVTKIAPPSMVSMVMGMWFLPYFFGNSLAGWIGGYWEKLPKEQFFLLLAGMNVAAGLGMFAVLGPLKRAVAHGRAEADV